MARAQGDARAPRRRDGVRSALTRAAPPRRSAHFPTDVLSFDLRSRTWTHFAECAHA
jgi:hypothetical protein